MLGAVALLLMLAAAAAWWLRPSPSPAGPGEATGSLTPAAVETAPADPAASTGTQPDVLQLADPARRKQVADYMSYLYRAIEQGVRAGTLDGARPAEVVAHVGRDPGQLLEWVRHNTFWVPYRGTLRGPVGVLADRLGNSLDRSLLLLELLRLAGHRVRLAAASLTDTQVDDLLAHLPPVSPDRFAPRAGNQPAPQEQAPAESVWVQDAMRRSADAARAEGQARAEEARLRAVSQSDALLAALRADAAAVAPSDTRRAAARDHWWVQRQDGQAWIDLDLLAPDSAVGSRLAGPTRTFDVDAKGRVGLDSAQRHELLIRVIAEQWKDGGLHERPVLEHVVRPAEFVGQAIAFYHAAPGWPAPDASPERGAAGVEDLRNAVIGQKEWVPVLRIGEDRIAKAALSIEGDVTALADRRSKGPGGSGAGGMLGGLAGGLGSDEEKGSGCLTAEWIEYEIRAPGSETRKTRHEVFDLLGPAARAAGQPQAPDLSERQQFTRGLAMLATTETLPLVSDLSSDFVLRLMADQLLAGRERWLALLLVDDVGNRRAAFDELPQAEGALGPLYGYAVARRRLSPVQDRVFQSAIGLVNFRVGLSVDEAGGIEPRALIDVVANDVSAFETRAPDAFAAVVRQGVADTAAEHLVIGEPGACANTTTVFALAAKAGLDTRVVRDSANRAWAAAEVTPDTRARVDADLAEGRIVVMPASRVERRFGWWRVDARTGVTIGVMDDGFRANTERATLEAERDQTMISNTVIRGGDPRRYPGYWSRNFARDILRDRGMTPDHPNWSQALELVTDLQWEILSRGLGGVF